MLIVLINEWMDVIMGPDAGALFLRGPIHSLIHFFGGPPLSSNVHYRHLFPSFRSLFARRGVGTRREPQTRPVTPQRNGAPRQRRLAATQRNTFAAALTTPRCRYSIVFAFSQPKLKVFRVDWKGPELNSTSLIYYLNLMFLFIKYSPNLT